MIILPDRNVPRAKFLMPLPKWNWQTPSSAQQKDDCGNEDRTQFCATARTQSKILWRGYFHDRQDFDEFCFSAAMGNLQYDPYIQRLPVPWWNPDLVQHEDVWYEFATQRFLTTTNAANQTDTNVAGDWNSSSNFIEVIASGGSGGASSGSRNTGSGGSAGGWSRKVNVSLTPGTSPGPDFRLPAGGAAQTATTATNAGNAGADAWYNGTTLAGASVGAKGGLGGNAATLATANGVSGGAAGSGIGDLKQSGGGSGNAATSVSFCSTGGGGAAGPNGDGVASGGTTDSTTAGGNGDSGSGGAGGNNAGGAGAAGTEMDATHGSGGGGGANRNAAGATTAGSGGLYGSGGGGAACTTATLATSGAGRQAVIYLSHTVGSTYGGNMPMMGL